MVAVDDGSLDGGHRMLERAARSDGRLHLLRTPPLGLVHALNAGIEAARAPLVARMDADDVADADRLAVQARRLEADPHTEILGCRVRLLGRPGHGNDGMRAYVDWLNGLLDHESIAREIWVESPLVHPSVMMRTATLRALGGYRPFNGPEDYDLWLRAHRAGLRFEKVPETLLAWRDSSGRLTRTDARYAPERFRALKIEALEAGPLPAGRGVVVWGAGPVGKGWARALTARGHAVVAFVEVDPNKIGGRIHGVPVVDVPAAAAFRGPLHLAAVGQRGARGRIRREAASLGLVEGPDLLAVA